VTEPLAQPDRGGAHLIEPTPTAHSEDALLKAYQSLVASIDEFAVILLDATGHVLSWNLGAEAIEGYTPDEIIGQHIRRFYTPEAVATGHPDRELEIAALTGRYDEDGWRVRKDGTRFWARVQILALRDESGEVTAFGKVTRDLTDARQREDQLANGLALLEKTVRIDSLTGLPNRRAWDERLAEEIAHAQRESDRLAVAFMDLDHFKAYNDEFGHLAGDELLKRAAVAWKRVVRPRDVLARYGGEEFVLALPSVDGTDAFDIVTRVVRSTPPGRTCSAGIALWDGLESGEQLIRRADKAMYAAKNAGRNRVHLG
jgi:diguanylate cyclase (GGDEF)-like protein/PAS domain S-box-containing protein